MGHRTARQVLGVLAALCLGTVGLSTLATTSAPTAATSHTASVLGGSAAVVAPVRVNRYPTTYAESLTTAMPPDLAAYAPVSARCAAQPRLDTPRALAAENAKFGDSRWRSAVGPNSGRLALYLDAPSADCGQMLGVHVNGTGHVRLLAYRVGNYGAAGARLIWTSAPFAAHSNRIRPTSGPSRMATQDWPISTRFTVPPDWPPGFYLIAVASTSGGGSAATPLIVHSARAHAPLAVVASDLTWQAYNTFGGHSLYTGPGRSRLARTQNRSYEVGFARPYEGSGIEQFTAMDLPIIRFLQAHDLPADIVTATDVDAHPSLLRGRAGVIIPGHSEYWTSRLYDAVEAARNEGTNLAILGANEAYWQARLSRDKAGHPLTMTVYRDPKLDPRSRTHPLDTTTRWSSPPLGRDETQLTGASFAGVSVFGPERVMDPSSWLLKGTGVRGGQLIQGLAGNEVDSVRPPHTGDRRTPPTISVILEGAFPAPGEFSGLTTMTVSYYSSHSGAGVFNAGTTYWACNLDASCPQQRITRATQSFVDSVTLTVLTAFSQPRAGDLHPSVNHAAVASAAMTGLLGPAGIASRRAPMGPASAS